MQIKRLKEITTQNLTPIVKKLGHKIEDCFAKTIRDLKNDQENSRNLPAKEARNTSINPLLHIQENQSE